MTVDDKQTIQGRCPKDDVKAMRAEIQIGPHKFEATESEIAAINAVMAAITTLGALMIRGVKEDFSARVAIGVFSRIASGEDRHVLCPVIGVLSAVEGLGLGAAVVIHDTEADIFRVVPKIVMDMETAMKVFGGQPEEAGPPPPEGQQAPPKDDGGGIFGG